MLANHHRRRHRDPERVSLATQDEEAREGRRIVVAMVVILGSATLGLVLLNYFGVSF